MKALIWLGCIFVYSLVKTFLSSGGEVLGAIPSLFLSILFVFLPAPCLCKQWDEWKAKEAAASRDASHEDQAGDAPAGKDADETDSTGGSVTPQEAPPILFCRKCGSKLLPESNFCSECGAPIVQ